MRDMRLFLFALLLRFHKNVTTYRPTGNTQQAGWLFVFLVWRHHIHTLFSKIVLFLMCLDRFDYVKDR